MIYLIKGKNGAGKTFLTNQLYKLGYERSISFTTREPRKNEIKGYDYEFVSKEEFEKKIDENFFVEYQLVNGDYYGTPLENLRDGMIFVSSYKNFIEKYYKGDMVTFYIDAPLELRYKRVLERGTTEQEIFEKFTKENINFLYDFKACFIDNSKENESLSQILDNMQKPNLQNNKKFLYQNAKKFRLLDTSDELLAFLQFEEFLINGIYLDDKIKKDSIKKVYFKYMKNFLYSRKIKFEIGQNGECILFLNGNKYNYTIDINKIVKKGEKETYEKEID